MLARQIKSALSTGHLILIVFYQDEGARYEWLEGLIRTHAKRVFEVIRVHITDHEEIAFSLNIRRAPSFVLLHRDKELWRQVGEMTEKEFKEMLDDFR